MKKSKEAKDTYPATRCVMLEKPYDQKHGNYDSSWNVTWCGQVPKWDSKTLEVSEALMPQFGTLVCLDCVKALVKALKKVSSRDK